MNGVRTGDKEMPGKRDGRAKKVGARRPSVGNTLGRQGGLQRKTDGTEGERHTRWRMCVARQAKSRRGDRQNAEVVTRCNYQGLARGLILDQLAHTDQGDVVATELVTVRRRVVMISTVGRVRTHRR